MPFLWLYRGKCPKVQIHMFLRVGARTNPNLKAFQNSLSSPLSIHKISSFGPTCGEGVFWNEKPLIPRIWGISVSFPWLLRGKHIFLRSQQSPQLCGILFYAIVVETMPQRRGQLCALANGGIETQEKTRFICYSQRK